MTLNQYNEMFNEARSHINMVLDASARFGPVTVLKEAISYFGDIKKAELFMLSNQGGFYLHEVNYAKKRLNIKA